MASATTAGRSGPWLLGLGLSLSFALAGTVLTLLLLNLGLDTEVLRYLAAALLLVVGIILVSPRAAEHVTGWLQGAAAGRWQQRLHRRMDGAGPFGIGLLLGVVWLPCVGPTLGTAIALASLGQNMAMAFLVMLVFGLGTSMVLLMAGGISTRLLRRWNPAALSSARRARQVLGAAIVLLAVLVLTGWDKIIETVALGFLPDWAVSL